MATKKARLSYKDVLVCYMRDGIEGVQTAYEQGQFTSRVLWRTIQEVPEDAAADLHRFISSRVPGRFRTGQGRGRTVPVAGEVRKYKVQQLHDGQLFVRLPVEPLEGIRKGSVVRVVFAKDRILASTAP